MCCLLYRHRVQQSEDTEQHVLAMEEQGKTSGEKNLSEMETRNLPDKEFRVTLMKMLAERERKWMSTEIPRRWEIEECTR